MISHPDQRVGVFIDTQNMYYSARYLHGRKVNFGNIVRGAVGERKLIRAIAYVVRTKTEEEQPFFEALQKLGIETRQKLLMEYSSGQKKADWDVGLTVDAIRMIDMLDVIVLVSGDGDFVDLIEYVKNRGRIVEVMSFRGTSSTRLVEAADKYSDLSKDMDQYLIGPRRFGAMHTPRGGEVLVEKEEEKAEKPKYPTPPPIPIREPEPEKKKPASKKKPRPSRTRTSRTKSSRGARTTKTRKTK